MSEEEMQNRVEELESLLRELLEAKEPSPYSDRIVTMLGYGWRQKIQKALRKK